MASRLSAFAVGALAYAAVLAGTAAAQSGGTPPATLPPENCWTTGPGQFADALHFCVSSELPSVGTLSYGPRNLADGDPGTAWCEGVDGPGIGEFIELRIDRGPAFRRLLIGNGYQKSDHAYHANGRIRTVELTTDTGVRTVVDLIDQPGLLPIYLTRILPHRWVRLTILDVYPGTSADTCVDFLSPDFAYEEELLQRADPAAVAP